MRIYWLRHADAVDSLPDANRQLSSKGRDQSRAIGRVLSKTKARIDAAFSSPLVRAVETLALVLEATELQPAVQPQISEMLLNETSFRDFERWLADQRRNDGILIVGHAPSLPARLGRLLGSDLPGAIHMSKAALACVEWHSSGDVELRFLITPKLIAT